MIKNVWPTIDNWNDDFSELGIRREILFFDGARYFPISLSIGRRRARFESVALLWWTSSMAHRLSFQQDVSRKGEYPRYRLRSNNTLEHVVTLVGMREGRRRYSWMRQSEKIHLGTSEMVVHSFSRLLFQDRLERHVLDIVDQRADRYILEGTLLRGRILQVIWPSRQSTRLGVAFLNCARSRLQIYCRCW